MAHGGTGGHEPTLWESGGQSGQGDSQHFCSRESGGRELLNRPGELKKGDSKVGGNAKFKALAFIPYR